MAAVKPPRSAFINFPLGRQCGKPGDADLQTRILKDTLNILAAASNPGEIVDLQYEWGSSFSWNDYMQDIEGMIQEEGSPTQNWKIKKNEKPKL